MQTSGIAAADLCKLLKKLAGEGIQPRSSIRFLQQPAKYAGGLPDAAQVIQDTAFAVR
jgi:hypothetical protein